MVRIGSWDDGQCENYTSFLGEDLVRIYWYFDLQSLTDDERFLPIPTGCSYPFGVQCYYKIHSEELYLFFMAQCKKGFTIKDMVNELFGGSYNWWSYGWPGMCAILTIDMTAYLVIRDSCDSGIIFLTSGCHSATCEETKMAHQWHKPSIYVHVD